MFHSRVFAGMIACFGLIHVGSVPLTMKPRKINTVSKTNLNTQSCPACIDDNHDDNALYCKSCGEELNPKSI